MEGFMKEKNGRWGYRSKVGRAYKAEEWACARWG